LDVCGDGTSGAELEDGLRQAVRQYIESGIVGLDQVKARALEIVAELLRWGDATAAN